MKSLWNFVNLEKSEFSVARRLVHVYVYVVWLINLEVYGKFTETVA